MRAVDISGTIEQVGDGCFRFCGHHCEVRFEIGCKVSRSRESGFHCSLLKSMCVPSSITTPVFHAHVHLSIWHYRTWCTMTHQSTLCKWIGLSKLGAERSYRLDNFGIRRRTDIFLGPHPIREMSDMSKPEIEICVWSSPSLAIVHPVRRFGLSDRSHSDFSFGGGVSFFLSFVLSPHRFQISSR